MPAKWTDALQEYEKEREDALAKKALDLAKLVHVGNIPSTEATEAKLVKLFAPYAHLSESAFTIRLKGDPGSRDSWAVVQLPSTVAIKEFLELQVWARSNLDDPDSRGQQLILATYKRKAKAAPATEEESWSMNSAANAASSLVRNTSVMDLGKNLKHSAMGIGMEEDHGMSDRILRDAQHKAAGEFSVATLPWLA